MTKGTASSGKMMEKLVGILANLGDLSSHGDDDSVDRLSRRYTTFFLVVFAILVSTKQYVGDPISCWVPAQFTENHEVYTNKVCWVSNTYYLPFEKRKIPAKHEGRQKIGYYQWIPMILLTQAVLFYIPCILWRLLSKRSGINVKMLVDSGHTWQHTALTEARERTLRYMVHHVDSYLSSRREGNKGCWSRIKRALSKKCICIFGLSYGNYLTCIYLLIKLLYIGNCIGQLFMLNIFLDTDYHMFGIKVILSLINGEDWRSSVRFPRVTLCDFEVRTLANIHKHTVQCVLPINLFNEKIFVFIWFWFVFVAMVTVLSFLQWLCRSIRRGSQKHYVKSELMALDRITRETKVATSKFTTEYLRQDGLFILRMLAKNTGELVAAEVLSALWDIYIREHRLIVDSFAVATAQPPTEVV